MSLVCSSSAVCGLSCASSLEEAFFWDDSHADQFVAVCGLSTDRLTPHPFNLFSNADSTHISIYQTQSLDMTLSTCTQLCWSTMARPVLSGTCSIKLLCGLGHRAARFKICIRHIHNYTEYDQQWNVSQVRSMDSAIIWNTNAREYT